MVSSSTSRKSEFGKSKRDSGSDSDNSSSSSDENDDEIVVKKSSKQRFAKRDSQSSDDEDSAFNQKSKLNKLNRKRKIQSSQSSSDSSSDSEKEDVKQAEMKHKRKQLKKQLSRSSSNWNSDSDDEQLFKQAPAKHKNASPSHSTAKKSKLPGVFDKKTDSKDHHKEDASSNAKKRPHQESLESKHVKDEKLMKKKKLQKSSSDLMESDSHKKEEKKSSLSKSSEQMDDSDDLSTIMSKSSNSSLKKKKKKDKLEKSEKPEKPAKPKDKNQLVKSMMSPKSGGFSSKASRLQQVSADLAMSDSDDEPSPVKKEDSKTGKSSKKESSVDKSKVQHKAKKLDKHEKKLPSKEESKSKSSRIISDSDDEPAAKASAKKPKKVKSEKERKSSNAKEPGKSKQIISDSSDSSDDESIVVPSKNVKKTKEKAEKDIKRGKDKVQKQHSNESKETAKKVKQHNERHSSISDLSMKQHYSDKAMTSDSESDSESDNRLSSALKSPKNTVSEQIRIFNTLANRNSKVFSSSDSEQSDPETSKGDASNVFLSPDKHLANSLIDNNNPTKDLWLMENTPKCDEWNDITKTEESFNKYLAKSSIHSSTDYEEESDDETLPKSTSLISNPLLPSPPTFSTTSTVNHALESQIAKSLDSRPLTSSTGKEVLKAIKSPKKAADHLSAGYLPDQSVNKHKKKDSKQKEDKCKENNEDRKIKKNKKSSKEHRDQKHIKDDKKLLNSESSLFDLVGKEIRTEPVIAAAATIHPTQMFGHSPLVDPKSILHQPPSPFSEKQAHQMNASLSGSKQRLLTDMNNSSLFGGNENKSKLHSPIKTSEESNSKKLIKVNEMMFSISDDESSNDNFLPTIGVSFCSSSSNSSSNSNQNLSILPSLAGAIKEKLTQDKQQPAQQERKFDEEAEKETKRLEAELKTKDVSSSWKTFKDPAKDMIFDLMSGASERLSTSSNSSNKSSHSKLTSLPAKPIGSLHKKPVNKSIVRENATTIFNDITSGEVKDPFLDSDETQFKIADGKDELDDQRKIEDDLAVESLLQLEMNSLNEDTNGSNKQPTSKHGSGSSGTSQRKLSSEHKLADQLHDEEPNRLQIAEDLNENSVDSDVFHSAGDEMLDSEAALAVSAITSSHESIKITQPPVKSHTSPTANLQANKLRSPMLSPTGLLSANLGLPTIIEAKPVPNIVDAPNNMFSTSDYAADEDKLTIDFNDDEDHKKSPSITSFMSTLEKLTTNNGKQRKNSSASTSSLHLFDLPKDAGQLEIDIPTSLADVKQAVSNKNLIKNTNETLISPKQAYAHLSTVEKESSIRSDDASDQSTDALLQSPNSQCLSSSHANKKLPVLDEESSDKLTAAQERPRRGRRTKTRKSSESEDGLKINTPLSPTNQSTAANVSPNSSASKNTRRMTRGLAVSTDSNLQDDLLNENLSEDNKEHDDSLTGANADCKRGKRGRKKRVEAEKQPANAAQTTKNTVDKSEANKYDVFEFNDSEEENSPAPMMTLHGAIEHHKIQDLHNKTAEHSLDGNTDKITSKETIGASTFFEQITPITPLTQPPFSLTTSTSPTSQLAGTQQSEQDKEYTTELNQQTGKITIRLQQKDKEQLSSSPEHQVESEKLADENQNSNSTDLPSSSKPTTRKSARLMSQNKTTIDEVIEDVVKGMCEPICKSICAKKLFRCKPNNHFVSSGMFNEDSHDYSPSATENAEYQDLEEEPDSADNDSNDQPDKQDEYSFEEVQQDSKDSSSSKDAKQKESVNSSSLNRPFGRVTRSSAKNVNEPEGTETAIESVEIKLPNTTVSTSLNASNTVDQTSLAPSLTTSASTASKTATTTATSKHTVMKVEIPKFTKTSAEQPPVKSADEIKKEDITIDPLISKMSSSSITTKPSPTASPQVMVSSCVPTPEQTKTNMSSMIQANIPNISERIHNSTTAMKLKTGKFNLDDYQLSSTPSVTIPSSTVVSSICDQSAITNVSSAPQIAAKIAVEPMKAQPCMPTSVVTSSASSHVISSQPSLVSQSISPIAITQPPINSGLASIPPASSPFKDDLQAAAQLRMKDAKTPSHLVTAPQINPAVTSFATPQLSSPFAQMPASDFNLLQQHMQLLQMQHPNQAQFMNNPYMALHPDLRNLSLGLAQSRFAPSPFNLPLTGENMKELEDAKLKSSKSKEGQLIDQMSSMPPPLGSLQRLQGSIPPSVIASNAPLSAGNYQQIIRTPIQPHLLSPHDSSNVNQQRFTESPAIGQYGRPLMSPNLKDMKPAQLLQATHQGAVNKPFEMPQRPHSTFGMSTINSPSPVTGVIGQANSGAQLSPSLSFRKDLHSPMSQMDLAGAEQQTAMHPRKLHQRYVQKVNEQPTGPIGPMGGLMPPFSQLPPHLQQTALLNSGLSYQQFPVQPMQAGPIIQAEPAILPPQAIQPPLQQPAADQSGGDSILIQKYPKLWQGLLEMKNDQAAVQMHFVTGNPIVAQNALPQILADGTGMRPLKIEQRMRLEQKQLDGVCRKMQQMDEHCILLALPCGRDTQDVIDQSDNLRSKFIQYLQAKQAAGIINSNAPGTNTVSFFPMSFKFN